MWTHFNVPMISSDDHVDDVIISIRRLFSFPKVSALQGSTSHTEVVCSCMYGQSAMEVKAARMVLYVDMATVAV